MIAFLIIVLKLLFVGAVDAILMFIVNNGAFYLDLFFDKIYLAIVPTSWFVCMAWAYDERYALFASITLTVILLFWLVLVISMIMGLFSKKIRNFAKKICCAALLMDVIASLFVIDLSQKFPLLLANIAFLAVAFISLKKASEK